MEASVAQPALFGSERHAGAETAHLRQVEAGLELLLLRKDCLKASLTTPFGVSLLGIRHCEWE